MNIQTLPSEVLDNIFINVYPDKSFFNLPFVCKSWAQETKLLFDSLDLKNSFEKANKENSLKNRVTIDSFPHELLENIFEYINPQLCCYHLNIVCKRWDEQMNELLRHHWNSLKELIIKDRYLSLNNIVEKIENKNYEKYILLFKTLYNKCCDENELIPVLSEINEYFISKQKENDDQLKSFFLGMEFYLPESYPLTYRGYQVLSKLYELNWKFNVFGDKKIENIRSYLADEEFQKKIQELISYPYNYLRIKGKKETVTLEIEGFSRPVPIMLEIPLKKLPREIKYFKNLKELYLSFHSLTILPKEIGKLNQLERLCITKCGLRYLCSKIGSLITLKSLTLSNNRLEKLPKELGNLKHLKILDLSFNSLKRLPKEIGNLTDLEILDLKDNEIEEFPKEMINLQKLQSFNYKNNKIKKVQVEIKNLPCFNHGGKNE